MNTVSFDEGLVVKDLFNYILYDINFVTFNKAFNIEKKAETTQKLRISEIIFCWQQFEKNSGKLNLRMKKRATNLRENLQIRPNFLCGSEEAR